jgi:hypothetical protein
MRYQVTGHHPFHERSARALINRADTQGSLVVALVALEKFAPLKKTVLLAATFRAKEPLRPLHSYQGIMTFLLCSVLLLKIKNAQAFLALYHILGHVYLLVLQG